MLEISNLIFTYPNSHKASLNGVSFTVARGQILGLLGPNGAGKTTLISHLSGTLSLQHGSISINKIPLNKNRKQDPTRLAIAPQEFAFYPVLTVTENLSCFAAASKLYGAKQRSRIANCIEMTQLAKYQNVRAEHLSGGLKRRLNLAIALLAEPDFLLLDEPTAGVDPQSRAFILETVKHLAKSNTGVIYTSHYMQEIEAIADYVVIMDNGEVLATGKLSEMLRDEQMHIRLTLAPPQEQALSFLADFGNVTISGDVYAIYLKQNITPGIFFSAIEKAKFNLLHAEFGKQSLEPLFISLTHGALRD